MNLLFNREVKVVLRTIVLVVITVMILMNVTAV